MPDREKLYEYVYRYIFDNIYNYSDITLKNNIQLGLMNNGKPILSMVYSNLVTAMMPNNSSSFYLFTCDNTHTSDLLRNSSEWMNTEVLLNDYKVNIDTITIDNQIIPKSLVYIKYSAYNCTLIAVDKAAYTKFGIGPNNTYITINVDSNVDNDRYMLSSIPGNTSHFIELITLHNTIPSHKTFGMINGYCYASNRFSTSCNKDMDYIELYADENIEFEFSSDLSERNTYWSEEEELYKDIFIIPRELTDGKVFTFDTITAIIRDRNGKGVILPYLSSKSVSSLTHTSFSISSALIDGALDKLGVDDGIIVFKVANYGKSNQLVNNGSVTELMYQNDDTFVMDALMNRLTPDVTYWSANEMESRYYGKTLDEIKHLNTYSTDKIAYQIECLGYYNYCTLLCAHTGEFQTSGSPILNLVIEVPIYWEDSDIFPIMYLDGNKIPDSKFVFTRDGNLINVVFTPALTPLFSNSILAYELILNEHNSSYTIIPSIDNQIKIIPESKNDLLVYIKVPTITYGTDGEIPYGYSEVSIYDASYFSVTTSDTDTIISFNSTSYGKEFVFITKHNTIFYHQTIDITDGHTIIYIPNTKTIDSNTSIDIPFSTSYAVYLNDRFMVPGIDFSVVKRTNTTNEFSGYQLTIQNLKFLDDTEPNKLEIYQTNRVPHRLDIGYVIDGIIPKNTNNEAYINGLSRLFVNGKLIPSNRITEYKDHYEVDSYFCNNGDVYCFVIDISVDFYTDYILYTPVSYFDGRASISNYFTNGYIQPIPDIVIVPYNHKIYSSYLNEIIKRILNDEIFVQYINNNDDILSQVAAFDYLKTFDTIFNSQLINVDYVDLYPSYLASITTSDLNKYLFINRLVKIILDLDITTDGTVVYTGR